MLAKLRHVHRTTHFITSWKYNMSCMVNERMGAFTKHTTTHASHNYLMHTVLTVTRLVLLCINDPKCTTLSLFIIRTTYKLTLCEWRRIKRWSLKAEAAVGTERQWSLTSVQLLMSWVRLCLTLDLNPAEGAAASNDASVSAVYRNGSSRRCVWSESQSRNNLSKAATSRSQVKSVSTRPIRPKPWHTRCTTTPPIRVVSIWHQIY